MTYFKRYWTTLPTLGSGAWQWNPSGDLFQTVGGTWSAPCDGQPHVLCRSVVPPGLSGRLVNLQFALTADDHIAVELTGWAMLNSQSIGSAFCSRPLRGFRVQDPHAQNRFLTVSPPKPFGPGDVLLLLLSGVITARDADAPANPGCSAAMIYGLSAAAAPAVTIETGCGADTDQPLEIPRLIRGVTLTLDTNGIRQQPLILIEASDGQVVQFVTVEDYTGGQGDENRGVVRVDYGEDRQVLPAGPLRVRTHLDCVAGEGATCACGLIVI